MPVNAQAAVLVFSCQLMIILRFYVRKFDNKVRRAEGT